MEWNGLKLFSASLGRGLNKGEVSEIMRMALCFAKNQVGQREARFAWHEGQDEGSAKLDKFMAPYTEKLRKTVIQEASSGALDTGDDNSNIDQRPLEGMTICVNAGNGGGGFFADVLESLGADCRSSSVHLAPDGTFPNHPANPEDRAHVDATIRAMTRGPRVADVGVMLDTDVDRCGLVDGLVSPAGTPPEEVNRNRLIALCAKIALQKRTAERTTGHHETRAKGSAGTVVTDSVTSAGLAEFVERGLGGRHERYKTGYRDVIDRAAGLAPPAVLAMETSGHSAWRDNAFVDDGCYTAARALGYLARERRRAGRPRLGLLDLLEGRLAEPAESIKVRLPVRGGLTAVPAAARLLQDTLVHVCTRYDHWELEKINHDGLRASVGPPLSLPDEETRHLSGSSLNGDCGVGWLIVRSSLHEPIISLHSESDVIGGTASICTVMLQRLVEGEGKHQAMTSIDLEPLRVAAVGNAPL